MTKFPNGSDVPIRLGTSHRSVAGFIRIHRLPFQVAAIESSPKQKMRKAIVVALDVNALGGRKREQASEEALGELNGYLAEGWNVVHSFAMTGTGHTILSATVVILEKD